MFFEGYQFNSVMPCLDALASSFKIMNDYKTNSSLVLYHSDFDITCYPFLNGKLDYK